jgi:hypothetical protein
MAMVIGQIVWTAIARAVFGETQPVVIAITPDATTKSVASSLTAMMPAMGALMAADRRARTPVTSFGVTATVIALTLTPGAIGIAALFVAFTRTVNPEVAGYSQ